MTTTISANKFNEQEQIATQPGSIHDEVRFSLVPRSMPRLTHVLRWGGGGILTAAAIAFMFEGVYSFAPMTRHWTMLALCGLLSVLGVFTGNALKEEKGARAFLGFAAASFPVLASQLGAMFFSIFYQSPAGMPHPLIFSLVSLSTVATVTILTLIATLPASYLAFRILARSQAVVMTVVFSLANLCIVLPVREGIWLTFLTAVVMCGILWGDCVRFSRDFRLESFEGRVARLLLTSPLLVIIGRSFFYSPGSAYYGVLLGLAGVYCAFHLGRIVEQTTMRKACQLVGIAAMIIGWLTCLLPMLDTIALGDGMQVYLVLLPIALVLGAMSLMVEGRDAVSYHHAAALVALVNVLLAHWFEATAMVSIAGVVVAICSLVAGILVAEKPVLIFGVMAAVLSLGNFCLQALRLHSNFAWAALAVIGIGVMLSASLLEKRSPRVFLENVKLWGRYKSQSE